MCGKGYARMPEYDNHISSYDHQHRKVSPLNAPHTILNVSQRLKESRAMTKDPEAAAKAKAAEKRANREAGMVNISIKPSNAPKKKAVFKSIAQSQETPVQPSSPVKNVSIHISSMSMTTDNDPSAAHRNGWYADRYDPRKVSGCDASCTHCDGSSASIRL